MSRGYSKQANPYNPSEREILPTDFMCRALRASLLAWCVSCYYHIVRFVRCRKRPRAWCFAKLELHNGWRVLIWQGGINCLATVSNTLMQLLLRAACPRLATPLPKSRPQGCCASRVHDQCSKEVQLQCSCVMAGYGRVRPEKAGGCGTIRAFLICLRSC